MTDKDTIDRHFGKMRSLIDSLRAIADSDCEEMLINLDDEIVAVWQAMELALEQREEA